MREFLLTLHPWWGAALLLTGFVGVWLNLRLFPLGGWRWWPGQVVALLCLIVGASLLANQL